MTTSAISAAALSFTSHLPRHTTPTGTLGEVLPETAKELGEVVPFEQKTLVPKKMLKSFADSFVVRLLAKKISPAALSVLTSTERDYVLNVLDEVYAWANAQGFEVAS